MIDYMGRDPMENDNQTHYESGATNERIRILALIQLAANEAGEYSILMRDRGDTFKYDSVSARQARMLSRAASNEQKLYLDLVDEIIRSKDDE